jgi:hypothetical protein
VGENISIMVKKLSFDEIPLLLPVVSRRVLLLNVTAVVRMIDEGDLF